MDNLGDAYKHYKKAQENREKLFLYKKMLDYVAEFEAKYDVDESAQKISHVVFDSHNNKYKVVFSLTLYSERGVDTIYMTDECAKGLAEELNASKVKLKV